VEPGRAKVNGVEVEESPPPLAAVCPWCLWELRAVQDAAHSWAITACTATEHVLKLYEAADFLQVDVPLAVLKLAKPIP
jgi:hypothetical protein